MAWHACHHMSYDVQQYFKFQWLPRLISTQLHIYMQHGHV